MFNENKINATIYKVLKKYATNRVKQYINSNGLITTNIYNTDGTISDIITRNSSNSNIRNLHYEYDDLYNVTKSQDNILNITKDYTYDELNRVKDVTIQSLNQRNSSSINYEYDILGNIIYKSNTSKSQYTYNPNKPHQVVSIGSKTFKYDEVGNMIKNDNKSITYTPFNKTSSIKTYDNNTVNYYYNPNKKRYKKSTSNNTTYYLDKDYEYSIYNNLNTTTNKYFIYANNQVIAIYTKSKINTINKTSSNLIYLYSNNLNSIDTITNDKGEVVQRYNYTPYGTKTSYDKNNNIITSSINRSYTGHENIDDNLVNMNARIYDASIGRFLNADTIIPNAYSSQDFNRYTYVLNNPLKYTDPSGHIGCGVTRIDRVGSDWIEVQRESYVTETLYNKGHLVSTYDEAEYIVYKEHTDFAFYQPNIAYTSPRSIYWRYKTVCTTLKESRIYINNQSTQSVQSNSVVKDGYGRNMNFKKTMDYLNNNFPEPKRNRTPQEVFNQIKNGFSRGFDKMYSQRTPRTLLNVSVAVGTVGIASVGVAKALPYVKRTAQPVIDWGYKNPDKISTLRSFANGFDAKGPNLFDTAHSVGYFTRQYIQKSW